MKRYRHIWNSAVVRLTTATSRCAIFCLHQKSNFLFAQLECCVFRALIAYSAKLSPATKQCISITLLYFFIRGYKIHVILYLLATATLRFFLRQVLISG